MNNKIKTSIAALSFAALVSSANAHDCGCKHNKEHMGFYVGVEGGFSAPVPNTFKKKVEGVNIQGKLSNSVMYGALLGYKFYPGMAAEFSYQHKPKYKLNITLPDTDLEGGAVAQKNSAKVKVTSDLYLLGLVYDLAEVKGLTPYVGVELGFANIKAKNQSFYSDIAAGGTVAYAHREVMRIKKSNSIIPAFQLSVGATKENIIKNVNLYAAARVQLIMNAKLKYDKIHPLTKAVVSSGKLKQSLLISEVVMGLTYNLPF